MAAAVGEAGWTTVPELLTRVSRRTVGSWVAEGKLVRIRPGVVALPTASRGWRTRLAAALDGRPAVASHVTALALWELVEHPPGPVHITADVTASGRGSTGVSLHRSPGILDRRRLVDGLAVTSPARSIIDTWGRPAATHRSAIRAAAITAVRRRDSSPQELTVELERQPRLAGRAELARLVSLLADGCQSELEIWGCLQVLRKPGMPPFVQQHRVVVDGQTFYLDVAYDDVLLAVEMDGAAWHGSRKQRERDIRRDALIATVGWQTLRFSYGRMTTTPEACRRDVWSVYTARRRLFGTDGVH